MNFPEISLLVIAALPILYRGWRGVTYGATIELRYTLTFFFAALVAARYWQPWAETLIGAVTFDPRIIATLAFLLLFGVGFLVAAFVVDFRAKSYKSVKANYVDNVLGLFAGLFSGALIAACILWVSTIAMPGKLDSKPELKAFCGFPGKILTAIETFVGVAPDSTGRTRYPEVTMVDVQVENPPADVPEGTILMQQRGKIEWK
ncbi:MAG: CvpA family protein [Chthoniobacterales bacterium]